VEKISPVSDEEFNHLLSVLHEETFDKGEVILREGQVCRRVYFIFK
jgi:CRP-like cAMP-binding protein